MCNRRYQMQSACVPCALNDSPVAVTGAASLVSSTRAIKFDKLATAAAAWGLKRYGWRVWMVLPVPRALTSTSTLHCIWRRRRCAAAVLVFANVRPAALHHHQALDSPRDHTIVIWTLERCLQPSAKAHGQHPPHLTVPSAAPLAFGAAVGRSTTMRGLLAARQLRRALLPVPALEGEAAGPGVCGRASRF